MSAEGKKKRGVSGATNAKNQPFRIFGGGCYPSHLATTMRTVGGQIEKIGRPREGSAWDKGVAKGGKTGGPPGLSYAEATAAEKRGR